MIATETDREVIGQSDSDSDSGSQTTSFNAAATAGFMGVAAVAAGFIGIVGFL